MGEGHMEDLEGEKEGRNDVTFLKIKENNAPQKENGLSYFYTCPTSLTNTTS